MNTETVTRYTALLTAAVAWLFTYVFHKSLPVEATAAIPFVVSSAVYLGVGKLFARTEPKVADVLAHVENLEKAYADLRSAVNAAAMAGKPAA